MTSPFPSDVATKQDIKDLKASTKQDIKNLEISTKQDIKDLEASTKTDLKKLEERLDEKFDKKLDKRFKENNIILKFDLKEYIDERLYAFENRMNFKFDKLFTRIDPLLGEIETAREDRVITTNDILNLKTKSKNHEERIQKMEIRIKAS